MYLFKTMSANKSRSLEPQLIIGVNYTAFPVSVTGNGIAAHNVCTEKGPGDEWRVGCFAHRNNPNPWWRHQMETFSALLALCAGSSPVPGEFPAQRPVTRSFDVFFDLRLNKQLSKQSWGWWIETQSGSLWRHCYAINNYKWAYVGFTTIWTLVIKYSFGHWIDSETRHIVFMTCVL